MSAFNTYSTLCCFPNNEYHNSATNLGSESYILKPSPPASDEVKNVWSYTSTHPYIFIAWCLIMQWVCLHVVGHS